MCCTHSAHLRSLLLDRRQNVANQRAQLLVLALHRVRPTQRSAALVWRCACVLEITHLARAAAYQRERIGTTLTMRCVPEHIRVRTSTRSCSCCARASSAVADRASTADSSARRRPSYLARHCSRAPNTRQTPNEPQQSRPVHDGNGREQTLSRRGQARPGLAPHAPLHPQSLNPRMPVSSMRRWRGHARGL
jgi:hypothetical protein